MQNVKLGGDEPPYYFATNHTIPTPISAATAAPSTRTALIITLYPEAPCTTLP